jgi:hypothetical protein
MAVRYCPKCRAEYQDWVEKCVDCKVKLVESRPVADIVEPPELKIVNIGEESYTSEPLVKIAEYDDTVNAQFSKDVLESEGIKSLVYDGNSVTDWIGIRPRMKIALIARQTDAEKALAILNSIDPDAPITIVPEIEPSDEDDAETVPD